MPKFLNNIDLNKNELQNAKIHNLGSAPSTPASGQVYFNTGDTKVYYYNGSSWKSIATLAYANITDGSTTAIANDDNGTFKIRSANGLLTVAVTNNDATHGDNVLLTVNNSSIDHGTLAGLSDDDHSQYILVAGTRAFTGDQSMGGYKITNLGTPSTSTDAATKGYVDGVATGLDVKASVRAATTANITLSGAQTIDGVSVIAGDRVLVKDQSTGADNGIYVCASGAWSRATDADASAEVTAGMFVFVEEGTTNADTGWVLTTDNAITLGSTSLVFTQFSGAGTIVAGAGLTKTGSTLDVGAGHGITADTDSITINIDGSTLSKSSSGLKVADGGITGTQLATSVAGAGLTGGGGSALDVGAGTGITVNANDVAVDTSVVVRKYATDVGDGAATDYVITHNLGTRDILVQLRDNTTPYAFMVVDVEATTTNTATLRFAVAPTSNQYRVIIHG